MGARGQLAFRVRQGVGLLAILMAPSCLFNYLG